MRCYWCGVWVGVVQLGLQWGRNIGKLVVMVIIASHIREMMGVGSGGWICDSHCGTCFGLLSIFTYKERTSGCWVRRVVSFPQCLLFLRLCLASCMRFMSRQEYLFDIKEISFQYATTLLSALSFERCLDNSFRPLSAGRTYNWPVMQHSGTYNNSFLPFPIPPSLMSAFCNNTYSIV